MSVGRITFSIINDLDLSQAVATVIYRPTDSKVGGGPPSLIPLGLRSHHREVLVLAGAE